MKRDIGNILDKLAGLKLATESKDLSNLLIGREGLNKPEVKLARQDVATSVIEAGIELTEQQELAVSFVPTEIIATSEGLGTEHIGAESNAQVYTPDMLGINGTTMELSVGKESFDGNKQDIVLRYTVAGAIANAHIDAASELLFPTLTIDPRESGVHITVDVFELYQGYTHSKADVNGADFKKTSLFKALNDLDAFDVNANILVPVYEAGTNDDVFVTSLAYTTKFRDKEVITAPIKTGKKVSLIGLADTATTLKEGEHNHRDTLNKVAVKEIFIDVDGNDADFLTVDVSPLAVTFTPTFDGVEKVMALILDTKVRFNTSTTVLADETPADAVGKVFNGLAANLNVDVNVRLAGQCDPVTGNTIVDGIEVVVVGVSTTAGVALDLTAGDGKAVVDALADAKIVGYYPDANLTNQNVRDLNILGSVTSISKYYQVPYRPGITIERPVAQKKQDWNDAHRLSDRINISIIASRKAGYETIERFFNTATNLVGNLISLSGYTSLMPTTSYIDPLIIDTTLDLTQAVDSERSGEKAEDIRGAIGLRIADLVDSLTVSTNFSTVHEQLNPGEKIVVNIVGGNRVIRRLNGLDFGPNIIVRTASLPIPEVQDKVYITLGTEKPVKGNKVDILNFGFRAYAPTLYSDINTGSSDKYNILHNTPRYLHIIQVPIGARLTVTGLDSVIGYKVSSLHKAV